MNTKNFHSMNIMHELSTNKANFLIKTTQDFNSSRHAAPHLPIDFTDNIILYFNWIPFVLHVFKRSRNAHIMFIFRTLHSVCLSNLEIFLQKKHLNFYFKTRNHFRDEITRLVINTRLITTLKNVDMFKIIEFLLIYHSAFCGWKRFGNLITHSLEVVLLVVHNFQNGNWFRTLQNVSINFLLFYKNNIWLKTDIMLDYC